MHHPTRMLAAALLGIAALVGGVRAQTEFTYQGRLHAGGQPYTGDADCRFSLWDAPEAGTQIGSTFAADGVQVGDGLFTSPIDFGGQAHGPGRYLQIEVRTPAWDGAGNEPPFFTFPERTPMTAAPYSLSTRGIFVNEAGDRVGIGTDAPTHPLHVAGDSYTTALIESPSPAGTWLNLRNTSANGRFWRLISTGAGNGEGAGNLLIGQGTSAGSTGTVMTLLPTGNVGIGTTSPKKTLHNAGDYYGKGHVWLHALEGDGQNGTAYIQARDDSGTSSIGMRLRTQEAGTLRDAVSIAPNANVGIGTTSPQRRLDVVGDVRFGGPDAFIELGDSSADTVVVPGAIRFGDATLQTTAYAPLIKNQSYGTFTLAGGGQIELASTVPGARPGMAVIITPPYRLWNFDVLGYAYVESNDYVVWRMVNTGGGSRTYGAATWRITVIP